MDNDHFDGLTRVLAAVGTRRGAVAALLGSVFLPLTPDAEARQHRKKKQRRRKRRHRQRSKNSCRALGRACGAGKRGSCCGNARCLDKVCSPLLETEGCGDGPPCPICQHCENDVCTNWPENAFACNGRALNETGGEACTTQAYVGVCINGGCQCGSGAGYDSITNQCQCNEASSDECQSNCCRVAQVCVEASNEIATNTIDCTGCSGD